MEETGAVLVLMARIYRSGCAGYLTDFLAVHQRRDPTQSRQPRDECLLPGDGSLRRNLSENHTE